MIEVDGEVHVRRAEYDAQRAHILTLRGLTLLRFTNAQVFSRTDEVLNEIVSHLPSNRGDTT